MCCKLILTLLLASLALGTPLQPEREGRDLESCNKNPALSIISALRASPFCTSFLGISTQTSTVFQTTMTTTTATDQEVVTTTVPGRTITIPTTSTITVTTEVVNTVTVTRPTTTTTTTYVRNGGPLKKRAQATDINPALQAFGSAAVTTACRCYVTTPTVTVTDVASATITARATTTVTTTITAPDQLVTTTFLTTTTATNNVATTATTFTTSVTTATGGSFAYVAQYNSRCVPFNYLTLDDNIAASSYDQAFQYCAARCVADSTCVQIWVSYNTVAGDGQYWCLTGGGPDFKTWTSNEIQCNYPPIGIFANWYNRA